LEAEGWGIEERKERKTRKEVYFEVRQME